MSASQWWAAGLVHEGFGCCQAPASPAVQAPRNVRGQRLDQETRRSVVLCPPLFLRAAPYLPDCSELPGRTPGGRHARGPAGQPMPARQDPPAHEDPQPRTAPPHLATPLGSLSLSPVRRLGLGSITAGSFFLLISGVRLKTTNVKFLLSLTHALSGY